LLAFAIVAAPLVVLFTMLRCTSNNWQVRARPRSLRRRKLSRQPAPGRANHRARTVVRQYLILDDEELLKDYARLRANFKANTSELSLQPLDEPQLHELNNTIDKEQGLYEQLLGKPKTAVDKKTLVEGYLVLSGLARDVLNTSNALIDREVESMRRTGEHAQRILWLQLAATIPLGVLLAAGVTLLIARPIRQLDQAIRRLGAGEFEGDNGSAAGGPEIPGQPARLAASAADRARTTEALVPAARLARAENAADGAS